MHLGLDNSMDLSGAPIKESTKLQECKYKNNNRSDQIPVLKLP
jgi:hypothetical protein